MKVTIKAIREKRGLRQSELAQMLGMDQANVSRYESGERRLTLENAIRIAHVLGCTVEELVEGETSAR